MSDSLTGTEWFFGLQELAARIRRTVAVPDSELTAQSEDDQARERAWLERNVAAECERLTSALKGRIETLNIDDHQRSVLVSKIEMLANVCFSAGVYQPWVERLAAIRRAAEAAEAVERAKVAAEADAQLVTEAAVAAATDQAMSAATSQAAARATSGKKARAQERAEVIQRHAEKATKGVDGRPLDRKRLIQGITDELVRLGLAKAEADISRTVRRRLNELSTGHS